MNIETLYINSLNEKEILAMRIAKEQLGSSFNLAKSNGMVKWTQQTVNSNTKFDTTTTAPNPPTYQSGILKTLNQSST